MTWLRTIVEEIVGLFVDDGRFALAIVFWLIIAALVLPHLGLPGWSGVILFAGLALILILSAHSAKRRS